MPGTTVRFRNSENSSGIRLFHTVEKSRGLQPRPMATIRATTITETTKRCIGLAYHEQLHCLRIPLSSTLGKVSRLRKAETNLAQTQTLFF